MKYVNYLIGFAGFLIGSVVASAFFFQRSVLDLLIIGIGLVAGIFLFCFAALLSLIDHRLRAVVESPILGFLCTFLGLGLYFGMPFRFYELFGYVLLPTGDLIDPRATTQTAEIVDYSMFFLANLVAHLGIFVILLYVGMFARHLAQLGLRR